MEKRRNTDTISRMSRVMNSKKSRPQRNVCEIYSATHGDSYNFFVAEAIKTRGEAANLVIIAELTQMISRKVWTPIYQHQLSHIERGKIIRSSMFLKEKFLATGKFEKLKAR